MDQQSIWKTLEHCGRLPVVPAQLQFLLNALNPRGSVPLKDAISLIDSVPEVKKELLLFLGSGVLHLDRPVETTRDAILAVGMRAVRIFVVVHIAQLLLGKGMGNSRVFDRNLYQNHVLGTAVAAETLRSKLRVGEQHELFAYGMIHDLGIALMDLCLPDQLDEIVELEHSKSIHQIVAEKRVLDGLTHADLGAWLCRRWQFPQDVCEAVEMHHAPQTSVLIDKELKILHVGDLISTNYYEKLLGLHFTMIYPMKTLESIGVTLQDMEEIGAQLPARVELSKKRLKKP